MGGGDNNVTHQRSHSADFVGDDVLCGQVVVNEIVINSHYMEMTENKHFFAER